MLTRFIKLKQGQLWGKKMIRPKSSGKDVIIYEKAELWKMTVLELRAMAKKRGINLKSKTSKGDIIDVILSYNKKTENYALFEVKTLDGEVIQIERTADWEINITQAAKSLNKRWRDWEKGKQEIIKVFEKLEGRKLIRKTNDRRYQQTFIDILLALKVIKDMDHVVSYQITKLYKKELLLNSSDMLKELTLFREKNELLEAKIASMKNKPIDVSFDKGENLLYAYECNEKTKFGTSYTNKDGQRAKSHNISIPDYAIGFIIYTSKENLKWLNSEIKYRYKVKREHVDCPVAELENFVVGYCDNMGWEYIKEEKHELKRANMAFKIR